MKLKTFEHEGKAYAVLDDKGLPVYVHDNGQEVGFDAASAVTKISTLNREAQGHREAKETAEAALKAYEGLDPTKARTALETMANLDAGQLVAAGKVDEIKAEAKKAADQQVADAMKAAQQQIDELAAARDKYQSSFEGEVKRNAFATSKTISDKFAIPADLVEARFGQNFKVEDGKIVGYDGGGNKIYSRASAGDLAGFDEALETLVSAYPYRDDILKSGRQGGSGAGQSGSGGGKTISRAEFEKLAPQDKIAKASELTIVD